MQFILTNIYSTPLGVVSISDVQACPVTDIHSGRLFIVDRYKVLDSKTRMYHTFSWFGACIRHLYKTDDKATNIQEGNADPVLKQDFYIFLIFQHK